MRSPKENLDMNDKNSKEHYMTQEEVAQAFGVTRNYIQQVEKRAMEKLRTELKKRGLKKEDYLGGD